MSLNSRSNTHDEPVLLAETLLCKKGKWLRLTLNRPHQLNALDLNLLTQIQSELLRAETDDEICGVFLDSTQSKAFCAGGDVKSLVSDIAANSTQASENFFATEYSLDRFVYHMKKPLVAWLEGLTLGGGMGLSQGARYRIGDINSSCGMPETQIGLFPDVGAHWFLRELPLAFRQFVGVLGSRLNADWAHEYNLYSHILEPNKKTFFLKYILDSQWTDIEKTIERLDYFFHKNQVPPNDESLSELYEAIDQIDNVAAKDNKLENFFRKIAEIKTNSWLRQEMVRFETLCPFSIAVTYEHLKTAYSLLQPKEEVTRLVFEKDFALACAMTLRKDFAEGVKTKLIEKRSHPRWSPPSLDLVDPTSLLTAFNPHPQQSRVTL